MKMLVTKKGKGMSLSGRSLIAVIIAGGVGAGVLTERQANAACYEPVDCNYTGITCGPHADPDYWNGRVITGGGTHETILGLRDQGEGCAMIVWDFDNDGYCETDGADFGCPKPVGTC